MSYQVKFNHNWELERVCMYINSAGNHDYIQVYRRVELQTVYCSRRTIYICCIHVSSKLLWWSIYTTGASYSQNQVLEPSRVCISFIIIYFQASSVQRNEDIRSLESPNNQNFFSIYLNRTCNISDNEW